MQRPQLRARLRGTLLAGLLVLAPVAVTVGVLVWLFRLLDGVLGPAIAQPLGWRIPGLGLVATVLVVFVLGLVSRNVLGSRLVGAAERLILRIPIARSLYGSSKGVLVTLAERPAEAFKRAILFEYPRRGLWSVGFVTGVVNRRGGRGPHGDLLTVFVPTTPNPTSGFLILVPSTEATELSMPVEDAVRLVISGGILQPLSWRTEATASGEDEARGRAER